MPLLWKKRLNTESAATADECGRYISPRQIYSPISPGFYLFIRLWRKCGVVWGFGVRKNCPVCGVYELGSLATNLLSYICHSVILQLMNMVISDQSIEKVYGLQQVAWI